MIPCKFDYFESHLYVLVWSAICYQKKCPEIVTTHRNTVVFYIMTQYLLIRINLEHDIINVWIIKVIYLI